MVALLIKENHYDIIHYLGPIGYHEPGKLYQLPIPYIWGPVGGLGNTSFRLLLTSDVRYKCTGGITLVAKKAASLWRLQTNSRVRMAFRESDVVVGATTDYVNRILRTIGSRHHSEVRYLPENCMDRVDVLNDNKFNEQTIRLIYVGSLETRKAPMLFLESLAKLGADVKRLHVDILGKGSMRDLCESFVRKQGLEKVVTFHGYVDHEEVMALISKAHLMVLPSLSDANTTVVWEAMSQAVPTMCLDHFGMHDTIKEGSGIKIPVGSWGEIVKSMTRELNRIVENPKVLRDMAKQLLEDRKDYTWEKRRVKVEELYELAERQFAVR